MLPPTGNVKWGYFPLIYLYKQWRVRKDWCSLSVNSRGEINSTMAKREVLLHDVTIHHINFLLQMTVWLIRDNQSDTGDIGQVADRIVGDGIACNCCQRWSYSASRHLEPFHFDLKMMTVQLNTVYSGPRGRDSHVHDGCHQGTDDIAARQCCHESLLSRFLASRINS